jgi:hypothetical protein
MSLLYRKCRSLDISLAYRPPRPVTKIDSFIMNISSKWQTNELVKIAAFWDVTPCVSCKNRSFGRTIAYIIREKISELGTTLRELIKNCRF